MISRLTRRLQEELPKHGFSQLTPPEFQGPYVVFASEGMGARFHKALTDEKMFVTLYKNRIRSSVSVYNDMHDIERLLRVLCAWWSSVRCSVARGGGSSGFASDLA